MQVHDYRACGVWRFPLIAVLIMLVIMSGNTPLFGQLIHGLRRFLAFSDAKSKTYLHRHCESGNPGNLVKKWTTRAFLNPPRDPRGVFTSNGIKFCQ
jgi:hypothetical protein